MTKIRGVITPAEIAPLLGKHCGKWRQTEGKENLSGGCTDAVHLKNAARQPKPSKLTLPKGMKALSGESAFRLVILFLALQTAGAAESARQQTIVLISGESEYDSARTLPAFKQYLATNYGFNCIYLERTKGEEIPGLDALEKADLAIIFVRRMTLPEEQLGKIKKFIGSGKPLIGLRTASHAFENWKEWDHDVLGGNYHNHYGNDLTAAIKVRLEAADHPILNGVEQEFAAGGSLYLNAPLPPSSTVLLMGSVTNHPPEPVAWTHEYKGVRIFYTSLGHPKDFENRSFRRLLVNAIYWTLNRPPPPVKKSD